MTLADDSQADPGGNLKKYLARLVKVGILAVAEERVPDGKLTSNGLYRYRLILDVGAKAPVIRRDSLGVYDPNNGREMEPLQEPPQAVGGGP